MSVLIVDDSVEIRHILRRFLETEGFAVSASLESAEAALAYLNEQAPGGQPCPIELILMDIMMGEMNGIEACRLVQSNPLLSHIPIVMVTAQPEAEELQRAFAAGAADYVRKPISRPILLARVRQALRLADEIRRRKDRELELLRTQHLLQEANDALQRLAGQDGLTGIANRRRFDEHLEQEWRRCKRAQWPLTVLVMDVDHFKRYNDTYGHLQGDECLRRIVSAVQSTLLRSGDLVARYGGEEFAVVLPKTSMDGARKVAQRIRREVHALQIPHAASPVAGHVTVSLGTATCRPSSLWTAERLLQDADAALYLAKAEGRNRVRCLMSPENPPDTASDRFAIPCEGIGLKLENRAPTG